MDGMLTSNPCSPQKAKPTTAGQPRPGGDGDADGLSDNASEVRALSSTVLSYRFISDPICASSAACTLLINYRSLTMTTSVQPAVAKARSSVAMAAYALSTTYVSTHPSIKRPMASGSVGIASLPNSNPKAWISTTPLTALLMELSARSSRSFKQRIPPVSLSRRPSERLSRTSGLILAANTKRLSRQSPSKLLPPIYLDHQLILRRTRAATFDLTAEVAKAKETIKDSVALCFACGCSSSGGREIIGCTYCPLFWHLDCLDPPLATSPFRYSNLKDKHHKAVWQCPNHKDADMQTLSEPIVGRRGTIRNASGKVKKVRRPKHATIKDVGLRRGYVNNGIIEILNDPSDPEDEIEAEAGMVPRLQERGIKLDFADRVRR